jgi:hypothetical protein
MRCRTALLLSLTLIAASHAFGQAEPTPTGIEPAQGFEDESTEALVRGRGFDPDSRVALLDGGLTLLSRHRLSATFRHGSVHGVELFSGHAAIAIDDVIQLVDLTDPRIPVERGSVRVDPVFGTFAGSHRGHLYVWTWPSVLVVDVRDLDHPAVVAEFPMGGRPLVHDGRLHDFGDSMKVWALDDPATPRFVAEIPDWGVPGTVDGNRIYGAWPDAIRVYELQESGALTERGSVSATIPIQGGVLGFLPYGGWRIQSGIARFAWGVPRDCPPFGTPICPSVGSTTYAALRLEDPDSGELLAEAEPLARRDLGSFAFPMPSVASDGETTFLARSLVHTLDATATPIARPLAGFEDAWTSWFSPLAVADDLVVTAGANGRHGLEIVVMGHSGSPPRRFPRDRPEVPGGYSAMVERDGQLLLVGPGLVIVDIRRPTEPRIIDRVGGLEQYALTDIALSGESRAVVATRRAGRAGVAVFDLGNPDAVEMIGHSEVSASIGNFTCRDWRPPRISALGDHAYLACGNALHVFDIGNPANPVRRATRRLGSIGNPDLEAAGGRVFLSHGGGVFVVERSGNLAHLGPGSGSLHEAAGKLLAGRYAYDASDPFAGPTFLDWGPGLVRAMTADRAFLVENRDFVGRVREVDVRDPREPHTVNDFATAAVVDLVVAGEHALVLQESGLRVARLNPPVETFGPSSDTRANVRVPAGMAPGTYDLVVSAPDGGAGELANGFVACVRRELNAVLRRVPGGRPSDDLRWRVHVDGDDAFFSRAGSVAAFVRLPDLGASPSVAFKPAKDGESIVVEMRSTDAARPAQVVLRGSDAAAARSLWQHLRADGGAGLSRLDAHAFGDIVLDHVAVPPSLFPQTRQSVASAVRPARYLFEFSSGALTGVRARGPGADVQIRVVAEDPAGCRSERIIQAAGVSSETGDVDVRPRNAPGRLP